MFKLIRFVGLIGVCWCIAGLWAMVISYYLKIFGFMFAFMPICIFGYVCWKIFDKLTTKEVVA